MTQAILIIYMIFPKILLVNSISNKQVLSQIHLYIKSNNLIFDISKIDSSTDLVSLGMDSIDILSLLAEIEDNLSISLRLEALEESNFVISAETIAYNLASNHN